LDSQSVTGGYQFNVHYGETTTMDVQATVFFRKKPQVVILAPLTSMFYFGENTRVIRSGWSVFLLIVLF